MAYTDRIVLLTSAGKPSAALHEVAVAFDVALVAMPFPDASAARFAGAAAVWAAPIDMEDAAYLGSIADMCGDRPLIVETPTALLDWVWHEVADRVNARIFVTPGPLDIAAMLMAIRENTADTVREGMQSHRQMVEEIRDGLAHFTRLLDHMAADRDSDPLHAGSATPLALNGHVASGARGYGAPSRPATAEKVRALIKQRRTRTALFGDDLFSDPSWDMLLDLYAATLDGQRVSVSSLCIAAEVPHATAWRRLSTLVERGLLQRSVDPDDGRRSFVSFTTHGRALMDQYFNQVCAGD